MKKYYFILFSLLLINGCSKNLVNWYSGNLDGALIAVNNKIIMIDFYTDWCDPCKVLERIIEELIPEYKDRVTFYKVNIEEESQLSEIFEVGHIPHFVMISKDG